MAEKAIITRSYNYNRWYWAVWFKGVRDGLYETKLEAQEKAKQYEKRNSINQSVEQQQGAN